MFNPVQDDLGVLTDEQLLARTDRIYHLLGKSGGDVRIQLMQALELCNQEHTRRQANSPAFQNVDIKGATITTEEVEDGTILDSEADVSDRESP